ncbi:putative IBR domain-containing protein [Seiridium cardinale]
MSAARGGIIQPPRGRPSKVTKPAATPRRPGARRVGLQDTVPNQDPDLEAHHDHDLGGGPDELDQQQHHDHHNDFDPEAAAAAAAAAAQHTAAQQQQQMDLSTAASILASSGANPMGVNPHEHPDFDQMGQHEGPEDVGHTTEGLAMQSGYQNVIVESALAKRLAREPGMRLAQQRRPEQQLNLQRRSNVEALFAHIAGESAPVPCKNCHKGHGPWTTCVIVDGQMCGSCANCWFNASGARCSFHGKETTQTTRPFDSWLMLELAETRNPAAHPGAVMGDSSFNNLAIPTAALGGFNYVSGPASADPVVKYTIERAMADIRAADKRTRHMLMIEAAAKQLAFQIVAYEETVHEEQVHEHAQVQAQAQGHPPPPEAISK